MPRILLVEDEEHLAAGIRFNFELEGYEVTIAPDGFSLINASSAGVMQLSRYDGGRSAHLRRRTTMASQGHRFLCFTEICFTQKSM